MKQHFIIKNNQKHLLLFFAGWGMDETPFLTIHPTDKDWMICYDYRSLAFDTDLLETYSQITLIAWSMGVWAASQIMKQYPHLPVSQSIAINGTLYPIHETKGIAHSIFDGTLQGLNEQTLQKFQRRMCGSIADYKTFQTYSGRISPFCLFFPIPLFLSVSAALSVRYAHPPAYAGNDFSHLVPDTRTGKPPFSAVFPAVM